VEAAEAVVEVPEDLEAAVVDLEAAAAVVELGQVLV
jgi:hypothetical protein